MDTEILRRKPRAAFGCIFLVVLDMRYEMEPCGWVVMTLRSHFTISLYDLTYDMITTLFCLSF